MIDSQYLMIHHYQYRQKQKEIKQKKELERIKELKKEIERENELEKQKKNKINPYISFPSAQFSNLERTWFNKISHD